MEKIICHRCQKNEVSFFCQMCPKQFNKLCFDCDIYVHSIIPYKNMHIRDRIENTDEYKSIEERVYKNEIIEEMKNKLISQNNLINNLNSKIKEFENKIYLLIEQIKNFYREKESYIEELNNLKKEIELYKKENNLFQEKLTELNITNNKLHEKESELEQIKY